MIFLNIQDKQFVLFRIKRFIESLHRKKKVLKRHSEEYKKVINQIAFYRRIRQKLEQCQGAVDYDEIRLTFTDKEEFYMTILLEIRGSYQNLKHLSKCDFDPEDEFQKEIHKKLQGLLRQILELDPTLFDYFWEMNSHRIRINQLSKTVKLLFKSDVEVDLSIHLYRIWIHNTIASFSLLNDYQSWRQENYHAKQYSNCGCPSDLCRCRVDRMKFTILNEVYRNVFFIEQKFPIYL